MKKFFLFTLFTLNFSLITSFAQEDHNFETGKNLDVFNIIYRNLDLMYVDTLDANKVVGEGIKAMLYSLDPYTEYYPESELQNLKQMITGKYAGIGAVVRENCELGGVMIDHPYPGMPAAEAGLRKGDFIVSIDDSTMIGKTTSFVSSHLRGDVGSTFVLKIRRPGVEGDMTFNITRKSIQLPPVTFYGMLNETVGYLNLEQYTEGCANDVRKAIIDLKGRGMKKFILDLRENGGGSVAEAISILNIFLPKDVTVLTMKGKIKRANNEYKTNFEPLDTDIPVVVLVNERTASSSEITAGALQDLKRATIMGSKTYGKGLVQTTVDLPYNGQMKFTTSRYYLPSGRCIQKIGITPDVELKADTLTNLVYYMMNSRDSSEVVFHYVFDYIQKHETIAPPSEFNLTDEDIDELKDRMLNSKFTYDRQTEKFLEQLKKLAEFEGYYEDSKPEFEALEKKLTHNLAKDIEINRELIRQMVGRTIVQNYYHDAGAMEFSLRFDSQIKAAIDQLNK